MMINQAITSSQVVRKSMMTTYLSNIPDELKQLNNCVYGSLRIETVSVLKYLLMQRQVSSLNQTIKVHGPVMKQQLMPKVSMG